MVEERPMVELLEST